MKLKSGNTYYSMRGNKVTVTLDREGSEYPFTGDNRLSYMEDGRYINELLLPASVFNLVSTKPNIKLEVGKTYIDGHGDSVKIVTQYHNTTVFEYQGENGMTYMADGRWIKNKDISALVNNLYEEVIT